MWRPKACPRCHGDMYTTALDKEVLLVCLLCGYERSLSVATDPGLSTASDVWKRW